MKPYHIRDYDLLVIGECLIEFSCDGDITLASEFTRDLGGADIVTAAAAARLGSPVLLVSSVARDPFHGMVRERLNAQGINTDHIVTSHGYNGLYFTSTRRHHVEDSLTVFCRCSSE